MTQTIQPQIQLLPGYQPLKRLGGGGYGEVWQAEVPGGLIKAVKVLHGTQAEQKAIDELKSLHRVKSVRHPFLLSLERIEVVDDRVIIVTELADESLRDRFDECLQSGKNGIARQELLGYLGDAADALDFMSEVHNLQHLDIKPENLLLVAGHVKVADFGLVKDIENKCMSLVSGLTPVYAAPEVFHGAPSRYSDQYSLAVVYQHMLTGTLPFEGVSVAEFALQHVSEAPDLSHLSEQDRQIVQRALEKDPERRFASSRAFVNALRSGRDQNEVSAPVRLGQGDVGSSGGGDTVRAAIMPSLDTQQDRPRTLPQKVDATTTTTLTSLVFPALAVDPVEELPPPQFEIGKPSACPTLLLGVGGSAAGVLRHYKSRVSERFGAADDVPMLATLLIDTDASALLEATHAPGPGRLQHHEALAVPLRRSQDYRNRFRRHPRWLSRRWLYNVPRSLRTDGLRPLGRLALVDHAQEIRDAIERSLHKIRNEEKAREFCEARQLEWQGDDLRVWLVASVSGGTGGGMVLDLGFMVGQMLQEMGISNGRIRGMLTHSRPSQRKARELASVNAFAWLSEYNHFNRPGAAFPGDPSCDLQPLEPDQRSFHDAYFIDLGEGLTDQQRDITADSIAEYLYMDTVSTSKSFFDACRHEADSGEKDSQADVAALRSLGLFVFDPANSDEATRIAKEVAHNVLTSWMAEPGNIENVHNGIPTAISLPQRIDSLCQQQCQRLKLSTAELFCLTSNLVDALLKATREAFLERMMTELQGNRDSLDPSVALAAVDRLFGGTPEETRNRLPTSELLRTRLDEVVAPVAEKLSTHIEKWFVGLPDDIDLKLTGAKSTNERFAEHLQSVCKELKTKDLRLCEQIQQARTVLDPSCGEQQEESAPSEGEFDLTAYFRLRMDQAATRAAIMLLRKVTATVTACRDTFAELCMRLRQLSEDFESQSTLPVPDAQNLVGGAGDDLASKLDTALLTRGKEWSLHVEKAVLDGFIKGHGGLCQVLCGNRTLLEQLLGSLVAAARDCIRASVEGMDLLQQWMGRPENGGLTPLQEALHAVQPSVLQFGGKVRRLLAAPNHADVKSIQQQTDHFQSSKPAVIKHPDNRLVICNEAEGVSLRHIALAMIRNRRDYADLAARVRTRIDIPWSELIAADPMHTNSKSEDDDVKTIRL